MLKFAVNDKVSVKRGVMDQYMGIEVGGWQGLVVETKDRAEGQYVVIAWDSATLLSMKPAEVNYLGHKGIDLRRMGFLAHDLTLIAASKSATAKLENPPAWGPRFKTLTRADVMKLADSSAIFKRGETYLRNGEIVAFSAAEGSISASVSGSYGNYSVEVYENNRGLKMTCSCPYEGEVCKHKVAVLLRFLKEVQPQIAPPPVLAVGGPRLIPNSANSDDISALLAKVKTPTSPRLPAAVNVTAASDSLLDIFSKADNLSSIFPKSGYGTMDKGTNLANTGRVLIQFMTPEHAEFSVRDTDGKIYDVQFVKQIGKQLSIHMTCTCPPSSRQITPCAHQAAAAFTLLQQARLSGAPGQQKVANLWEHKLSHVLSGSKATKKIAPPRTIILFSLQERYRGSGWKLTPYTMPTSLLDPSMLDNRAAVQLAVTKLGRNNQVKEMPYYGQPPVNPLFGTPELGIMARMVSLANYQQSSSVLSFVLPQLHDALLFRGDGDYYGDPFAAPILEVDPEPRQLQLSLKNCEAGTTIQPMIPDGDHRIILSQDDTVIVNTDPLWILVDDRLLRVEGDATVLQGFLESREIVIPAAEKKTFFARYLPKLLENAEISGDAIGQREELHDVPPVCRVYLSEGSENIIADVAYAYNSYELPLELTWPGSAMQYDEERETLISIHRDPEAEEAAWRAMNGFGLKRDGNRFVTKMKVAPVDFLLRHVPQLQEAGYEVYGEEAIKNTKINRNAPKVSVKVSSGIDWFDVMAVVSYGELDVAISEVRKAIKKRQGYVKLPDGSLGILPDEIIAQYRHLFAMGIETETGVRMSKTQAMLLEFALQGTDATVDAEYSHRITLLREFSGINNRPLPTKFCGELRHYQRAGYDWLHFLHDYGFGGCLADDMGIGKTVQALVFLQSLYESGHTASASLIVMPRSLLENWAREAARFTPDLKVLIHADGDRSDDHTTFDGINLVLTTYGVMLRDLNIFKKYPFHYVVLDEAQAIKNPVSQSARAARLLRCEHRLALTGTPVENSTEELWSLFSFLNPGQLGSQEAFREQFAMPIQRNQDENAAKALRALVHPFILRRTKEQVTPELPPRTERLIYCEMTASQKKLYQKTRDRYRAELLGMIDSGGLQQARFKVLEGLLRLRQLANDPRLVDKSYTGTSSKFEAILESLEVLREEGHRALIFSQFTSMLALLRTSLDERGWSYLYLDGKTKKRQELVDTFQQADGVPFFLISLKAGGTGLNLTAADYVIHIDPWWNPAVERQATDRTHRIGQVRPVMVYKFIAEETVEEKILLLQEKKQALVDQLISTEGGLMKSLTRDDVAALFE